MLGSWPMLPIGAAAALSMHEHEGRPAHHDISLCCKHAAKQQSKGSDASKQAACNLSSSGYTCDSRSEPGGPLALPMALVITDLMAAKPRAVGEGGGMWLLAACSGVNSVCWLLNALPSGMSCISCLTQSHSLRRAVRMRADVNMPHLQQGSSWVGDLYRCHRPSVQRAISYVAP